MRGDQIFKIGRHRGRVENLGGAARGLVDGQHCDTRMAVLAGKPVSPAIHRVTGNDFVAIAYGEWKCPSRERPDFRQSVLLTGNE